MRSRLAWMALIVVIGCLVGGAVWATTPTDIRMLDSGNQGVEFIYSPQRMELVTFRADDRQYTRIRWDNLGVDGAPGQPEIPVRTFVVGVPPGANPRVIIGREASHTLSDCRLPPIPTVSRGSDGLDVQRLIEDAEAYSRTAVTPGQWVTVTEPYDYRGFRLVKVRVYPVRFSAANNTARVLDNLHIRVEFEGGDSSFRSRGYWDDRLVEGMVINPVQTMGWHITGTTELSPAWPSDRMAKMAVRQQGIYKVTGRDLELAGMSLIGVTPEQIRLFNNGGRELPKGVLAERPDSLIENAIYVHDGDPVGEFDSDDYVLFYGHGVTGWDRMEGFYQHYIHHYTEDNIYWIQVDPSAPVGKRMGGLGLSQSYDDIVTYTKVRFFKEDENFIYNTKAEPESGLNWYMALFMGNQSHIYPFTISNVVAGGSFRVRARFKHLDGPHQVQFYLNNELIETVPGIGGVVDFTGSGTLVDGSNTLKIRQTSGKMYLDWFEFECSRSLTADDHELGFESPQVNGILRYELDEFTNARIFGITDPYDVTMTTGTAFVDVSEEAVWRQYFAVEDGHYRTPLSIEIVERGGDEYDDLRTFVGSGIDYIVIAADEFYDAVTSYEDHRETYGEGMETIRVRTSDIFDQFGWGLVDPAAIRDFLRYVSLNWSPIPTYLLLVGDGDYDYKNRVSGPTGNWIPPYEDGSRCYDDWYVYLSNQSSSDPEMAAGRWTVTSVAETDVVVQKVIQYEAEPLYGRWRHNITIVADDEYNDVGYANWEENHTRDSEDIAENELPRHFNLAKIYLIRYPVQWDAVAIGRRKPQATRDLLNSLNDGTLIVNYMGHGNPHVWAHEQVFVADRDLPLIYNGAKLPLFLAATCSWGLFDDPMEQSFPEQLLTAQERGSIASIAATRFTSASTNETFTENFYSRIFLDPFNPTSLGTAMVYAKTAGGSATSKYHIFGDPTLVIGAPRFQTRITGTSTDTLQALSLFSLQGEVLNESGSRWVDFSGEMELTVLDKRDSTTYIFDEGNGTPFTYILPGSPIFQGPSSINMGRFQSQFVVPLDIAYGGRNGRFSFYYFGSSEAYGDSADGAGVKDSVHFAETAAEAQDSIPPVIDLMLEDEFFREGDMVSNYPQVIARVFDSSGVNLTGAIGHTLRLVMDEETSWDVTQDFRYYLDSYTEGEMRTTIGPIEPGNHILRMEAWDSFNNFGWIEVAFEVMVSGEEGFEVTELLPYPNPFGGIDRETNLTFFITRDAWVSLKIYTVTGLMIYSQEGIYAPYGYNWELKWDGRDREGDRVANGVYLYKISATSISGEHASEIGRVVVMR